MHISDFWIFYFSIFKISNIGLRWSKITIVIIAISLKLHLHTKYLWNNPNSLRLGLKSHKVHFLLFLAAQKFIACTNIQIHIICSIFIVNWFFWKMLVTMSSIRINNNWNYQKTLIITLRSPYISGWGIETFYLVTKKYQFGIIYTSFSWCRHDRDFKFNINYIETL